MSKLAYVDVKFTDSHINIIKEAVEMINYLSHVVVQCNDDKTTITIRDTRNNTILADASLGRRNRSSAEGVADLMHDLISSAYFYELDRKEKFDDDDS
jgi:phosphopantetheine adenylyltransferase